MRRTWLAAPAAAVAVALVTSAALPAPRSSHPRCTAFPEPPLPRIDGTGPSLDLDVASDGAVERVVVDDLPLDSLPAPSGFSIRSVGGTPNLLSNGGFEDSVGGIPAGWRLESGATNGFATPALDLGQAHTGTASIRRRPALVSRPHHIHT